MTVWRIRSKARRKTDLIGRRARALVRDEGTDSGAPFCGVLPNRKLLLELKLGTIMSHSNCDILIHDNLVSGIGEFSLW
jgi:hypothetical protein